MRLLISSLIFISFAHASDMVLLDGTYNTNQSFCALKVINDQATGTLWLANVSIAGKACRDSSSGSGPRTGDKSFQVFLKDVDLVITDELVKKCGKASKPCSKIAYDANGKVIIQIGDLFRGGPRVEIVNSETFHVSNYSVIIRNNGVIATQDNNEQYLYYKME